MDINGQGILEHNDKMNIKIKNEDKNGDGDQMWLDGWNYQK